MKFQFPVILSGAVLLIAMQTTPVSAEDKIQAFLNSSGKLVFTNLVVENAPASSTLESAVVVSETKRSPVEEIPVSLKTLVDTISANHGVDPALVKGVM